MTAISDFRHYGKPKCEWNRSSILGSGEFLYAYRDELLSSITKDNLYTEVDTVFAVGNKGVAECRYDFPHPQLFL